jgi:pyruvoyl-dependent arginine decarboxylase (PvlArgDC)
MKQFLVALAAIVSVTASAQSDKYADAMKQTLALFDSAKTAADFENVSLLFSASAMPKKRNGCLIIGLQCRLPLKAGNIFPITMARSQ